MSGAQVPTLSLPSRFPGQPAPPDAVYSVVDVIAATPRPGLCGMTSGSSACPAERPSACSQGTVLAVTPRFHVDSDRLSTRPCARGSWAALGSGGSGKGRPVGEGAQCGDTLLGPAGSCGRSALSVESESRSRAERGWRGDGGRREGVRVPSGGWGALGYRAGMAGGAGPHGARRLACGFFRDRGGRRTQRQFGAAGTLGWLCCPRVPAWGRGGSEGGLHVGSARPVRGMGTGKVSGCQRQAEGLCLGTRREWTQGRVRGCARGPGGEGTRRLAGK